MTKAFLYLRRSQTRKDKQVLSLASQKIICLDLAKRHNCEIVEIFTESGTAADREKRPIFEQMMKRVENKEVQSLISWKLNRLSRNHTEYERITDCMRNLGLKKVITSDAVYSDTTADYLSMGIMISVAKHDIDQLKDGIMTGRRTAINEEKKWLHAAPIGYDWIKKKIVVDSETASFVKLGYELYSTGKWSIHSLTKHLGRLGMRKEFDGKKRPPSVTTIQRMLSNNFYIGMMTIKGKVYEGAHPPLISDVLFNKVQEMLGSNRTAIHTKCHNFPFKGKLTCADCGRIMTGSIQKGRVYYGCARRASNGKKCKQGYARGDRLIEFIQPYADLLFIPSKIRTDFFEKIRRNYSTTNKIALNLKKDLQSKIIKIEKKMDILFEMRFEGEIKSKEFKERKVKLKNEKRKVEDELNKLELRKENIQDDIANFLEKLDLALKDLKNAPEAFQKAFIQFMCSNLYVKDKKVEKIRLNKAYENLKTVSEKLNKTDGGSGGARTRGQRIKSPMLYQLSY